MAAPRSRTVAILASGPSMCPADADLIRDWRNGTDRLALAINNTAELAPWADIIYACDHRWWAANYDWVSKTGAALWAWADDACAEFGLNKADLKETGGNSGYQALRLMITKFNATRIILLGYDMKLTGGMSHWHGDHPKGWPQLGNTKDWRMHLSALADEFPNIEIINCSRETALECFPRMDLEDALCAVSPS